MKVITARIDDESLAELERIEKVEQTDRAEVIRKLLVRGIQDWKMKKALEELREGRVTIRKAAAIAGITYIEMLDIASASGLDLGYTLADLEKDVRSL